MTAPKLLVACAALALLAACDSTSDSRSAATGAGGAGSSLAGGAGGAGGFGGAGGTARPGSQEDLAANIGDRVLFETDSSQVGGDQRPVLQRQAGWLRQYSNVAVQVEGHADERGTREYNLALGQRRANAARDLLVADGVDGGRVSTVSYGKERPAALGSADDAWAQNRRAVTVVR